MRTLIAVIVLTLSPSIIAAQRYFPDASFNDNPKIDQNTQQVLANDLKQLEEEPVFGNQEASVYRFLWLRSFHPPIVVRVALRDDGTAAVTSKVGNTPAGNEDMKIVTRRNHEIGTRDVSLLLKQFNKARFWSLSKSEESDVIVLDGASWIIEAREKGRYRVLTRVLPNREYRKLGLLFLKLGDVLPPKKEIY